MKRTTFVFASLLLGSPAAAQFAGPVPVVDHAHILQDASHWAADLAKLDTEISQARQQLQQLGPLANVTTIAARLDAVNAALAKTQAAISSSACAKVPTGALAAACAPVASVLQQQAGQIATERQQITMLQNAPVAGTTAAVQALGQIQSETNGQLVELRQLLIAQGQQHQVQMQRFDERFHSQGTMTLIGSPPPAGSQ